MPTPGAQPSRAPDLAGRESASAFFVEEVPYLMSHFGGEEVLTGGLIVHTSLDVDDQIHAWRAVRRGLRDHDRRMGYRGPIRNVPKPEWPALLAEIATGNAAVVPGEDALQRGLVTSVDDTAQKITLALGPEEDRTHSRRGMGRPPNRTRRHRARVCASGRRFTSATSSSSRM
jgi:membrane carboxypeptidase/penicillin-binding protein